jgi:hypothetical protein
MKKSEKVLLGVFAFLFLAIIGGGGGMYGLQELHRSPRGERHAA